jgi:hypothetical protein
MRRTTALLLTAAAAASFASASPANATVNCQDLGPLPGWGPVCTVRCAMTVQPEVNPKNAGETLRSLIVMCPA